MKSSGVAQPQLSLEEGKHAAMLAHAAVKTQSSWQVHASLSTHPLPEMRR